MTEVPRTLVYVKWVDSNGTGGWRHEDEVAEIAVAEVESVGWLIAEDEKQIQIALNRVGENEGTSPWGSITAIPKVAILSRMAVWAPKP